MSILYATLLDAVGTTVTVETNSGCSYTGKLESVDKVGLNLRLSTVLVTQANGMKDAILGIIIPGTEQKFVKLPSTMKLAPHFYDARKGTRAATAAAAAVAASTGRRGAAPVALRKKKKKAAAMKKKVSGAAASLQGAGANKGDDKLKKAKKAP